MTREALAARARGLAGHLLPPPDLAALAGSRDLAEIARRLAAAGYPVPAGPPSVRGIERAIRQRVAADLRILIRWSGAHPEALDPVLFDEDRRNLRALLRGIVAGSPVEDRLASLVPTVELPAARLAALAGQASPAALAELLIAWRSPFGWSIGTEASRTRPDLFTLERALDRCFAARAHAVARADGRPLQRWVAHLIDSENAFAALALTGAAEPADPGRMFIERGERLDRAAFLAAVGAGKSGARPALARCFAGSHLAAALIGGGDLEEAALADAIREQSRLARSWPASAAPVLLFALRRRAEARAIRRAVWSVGLDAEVAA